MEREVRAASNLAGRHWTRRCGDGCEHQARDRCGYSCELPGLEDHWCANAATHNLARLGQCGYGNLDLN